MPEEDDLWATGGALDVLATAGNFDLSGTQVGEYMLIECIGEGGMGRVYSARRSDWHVDRKVAVKVVLRNALTNVALFQRFATEGQILAKLNHPNIAHLYDGGLSDETPYLVMELVDGLAIDQYADLHALTTRDRVRLCLQVCDAVVYAHDHLVIHRDIKPSNVLVTPEGVVKLLDFGISKNLAASDGAKTTHLTPFTPDYASPEQILGRPMTVHSDVYQIGGLLYELLGGQLVTSKEEALKRAASEEAPRLVANLVTDRDLLAVIEQCLQHETENRYESVHALRADLGRWLEHKPVAARTNHIGVRLAKWAARNRALAAALVVAGSSVLAGLYVYSAGLSESRQAAELAARENEAVAEFFGAMFEEADPNHTDGNEPTASAILAQGLDRIGDDLAGQPSVQLELYNRIAEVYYARDNWRASQEAAKQAQALIRANPELGDPLLDRSAVLLGNAHVRLDESDTAISLANRIVAAHQQTEVTADQLLAALSLSALVRLHGPAPEEAKPFLLDAIDVVEEEYGAEHEKLTNLVGNLGFIAWRRGRYHEAIQWFTRALDTRERSHGRMDSVVALSLHNLGAAHIKSGLPGSAIGYFEEELALTEELLPDSESHASVVRSYASNLMDLEQFERGYALAKESLDRIERLSSSGGRIGAALGVLIRAQMNLELFDDADVSVQRALQIMEEVREDNDEHPELYFSIAELRLRQGKYREAEEYFLLAHQWWTTAFGAQHVENGRVLAGYGNLLILQDRQDEAILAWRQAIEIWESHELVAGIQYADVVARLASSTAACPEPARVERALSAVASELPPEHTLRQRVSLALGHCGTVSSAH